MSDAVIDPPSRAMRVPGWLIVLGMLSLGVIATVVMYVYWDWHTKPFRSLTEAIGRTYKYSLPKVEGGRHKRGPMTLRVALRVPFEPDADPQATEETLNTVCRLITEHQDLTGYETVQIHFFRMVPEEVVKSKLFEFTPGKVRERATSSG